jgi:thiamine transport system ATP-binding protein
MTALEVTRLSGPARGAVPLDGVSLTVASGSIAAVFGDAYAGKRTFLRLIAGLDRLEDGGDIVLGEVSIARQPVHRRRVGVVLRDPVMFPGTVRTNIAFGLKQQQWPRDDRDRRIAEVLELVGLTGAEGDPVGTLSEDERARVALARALAPAPALMLIEAPTATIDEVLKANYRARLREVLLSIPVTTVVFTDDLRDAVGMADSLHVMERGRIAQSGQLSRVLSGPNSIRVAEMVGYVTLIRGEVDGSWILEPDVGAIAYPEGYPLKGIARALAHPSTMLGVPEESGLGCGVSGMIERVRATGPSYVLDLRIGDRVVEVRWEWDAAPPRRDLPIGIAVTPNTLRFFNEPVVHQAAGKEQADLLPAAHGVASEPDGLSMNEATDDDVLDGAADEATGEEGGDASRTDPPGGEDVEPDGDIEGEIEFPSPPEASDASAMPEPLAEVDELEGMGRPAPAPAPPRTSSPSFAPLPTPARRRDAGEEGRADGDADAGAMASRPNPSVPPAPPPGFFTPPAQGEAAEDSDERHRGMPLD